MWQLQRYDPVDYPGSAYRRGTGMHVDSAGFDEYCLWHYNPKPGYDKDQFAPAEFVMNSQYKLYVDERLYDTENDMLEEYPISITENNSQIKFTNGVI